MANTKDKETAVNKRETAVYKAVRKGVTKAVVESTVEQAIDNDKASKDSTPKKTASPMR